MWEPPYMPSADELRGRRLYAALRAIKPEGLAETTWAVEAGVNRGFFTNLKESEISPKSETLRKLLGYINKTHADLERAAFGGPASSAVADLPPTRDASDDDTVEIIALDLSLSMGPGTLIEEFVEEEPVKMGLRLVQSITRTPSNRLRLVRGIGDSMEPTLRTGDRVMVDINERTLSRINGIYWIDHLGTHGIKRLRAAGKGKIMVLSDNALIPDFEVDSEDLRIEGRVIWFGREL